MKKDKKPVKTMTKGPAPKLPKMPFKKGGKVKGC